MKCKNIPTPSTQPFFFQKPKGTKFVNWIESMGFELPLGAVMHLWDGRYESFSIDIEFGVFTLKIFGYDELVIYKTKYTTENTPMLDA